MAPNAAVNFQAMEPSDELESTLDKMSDTKGLANFSETSGEDWTDIKHSERKKRDRLLKDNVLIGLMQKSDYEGFKRLFENLTIMAITIYAIYSMHMLPYDPEKMTWSNLAMFIPLYIFYGFQLQVCLKERYVIVLLMLVF